MNTPKEKISVVSPVYRGEKMVSELVRRNVEALSAITDDYEIILVNDASPDDSWAAIEAECQKNPRVKGLNLSRNFGQHYAITAGLSYATGEWMVVMDCDLQDPPSLLPRMLEIEGSRYEYEMNVLLSFARAGVPILEEEIPTIYIDGNASSHFDTVRDSFRVFREILRFSASSLAGFATDYLLYSLLLLLTGSLALSNVGARMVSASVNYSLNRNFVFRHRGNMARSAFSYFLLAAVILIFNTLVLELLVTRLGAGRMAAKLLTELFFFIISWSIQRTFIFRKGDKNNDNENKTRSRCPAL